MQDYLNACAALLGHAQGIFPKQREILIERGDYSELSEPALLGAIRHCVTQSKTMAARPQWTRCLRRSARKSQYIPRKRSREQLPM